MKHEPNNGRRVFSTKPRAPKIGALDFSWLNDPPAGKHGYVRAEGEQLVFEDGTVLRLFGVNISFGSACPSHEVAEAMAEELVSMGVNFVRLHGLSHGNVLIDPDAEGIVLREDRLERTDYLIHCLKQKGIYLQLDTICGCNHFRERDGFTKEERDFIAFSGGRCVHLFDRRLIELDKQYIRALMTHFNPYTGYRYADDPAIVIVQYLNEYSIAWESLPLADSPFGAELEQRFNRWLCDTYGDRKGLREAWRDAEGVTALGEDENPFAGTVKRPPLGNWGETVMPWDNPSDCFLSPQRVGDFKRFLYDIEVQTVGEIFAWMDEIGVKALKNVNNFPAGNLDRAFMKLGDVAEGNAYWDHPTGPYNLPTTFHRTALSDSDPRYDRGSIFATHPLSLLSRSAAADMPFIVSEWNVGGASDFKADVLFRTVIGAAHQGWSGLAAFQYADGVDGERFFNSRAHRTFFDVNIDPGFWMAFGMAAALFRCPLVAPSRRRIGIVLSQADRFCHDAEFAKFFFSLPHVVGVRYLFEEDLSETDSCDLYANVGSTAAGRYETAKPLLLNVYQPYGDHLRKTVCRKAWLSSYLEKDASVELLGGVPFLVGDKRAILALEDPRCLYGGAPVEQVVSDTLQRFGLIGTAQGWRNGTAVSDTDQICLNAETGCYTFSAACAAVLVGRIQGVNQAGQIHVTVKNELAAVACLSLDGKPLDHAERILLYAIGRSGNSGLVWDGNTLTDFGGAPVCYEGVEGVLSVTRQNPLHVWRLDASGKRCEEIPVTIGGDHISFPLDGTLLYELEGRPKFEDSLYATE